LAKTKRYHDLVIQANDGGANITQNDRVRAGPTQFNQLTADSIKVDEVDDQFRIALCGHAG